MALFRRPLRIARRGSAFEVTLAGPLQQVVTSMLTDLDAQLDLDPTDPRFRRLHPPAYLDDDERQAAYQLLAGEELRAQRREAIAVTVAALERGTLSEDEMWAWLRALNALRLVLGTQLDVSDDGEEPDLPPDHPDAPRWSAYHLLTFLQFEVIQALEG